MTTAIKVRDQDALLEILRTELTARLAAAVIKFRADWQRQIMTRREGIEGRLFMEPYEFAQVARAFGHRRSIKQTVDLLKELASEALDLGLTLEARVDSRPARSSSMALPCNGNAYSLYLCFK